MVLVMNLPARLRAYYEPGSPTRGLADRLRGAGYECYLVGGTVRDAFLGVASPDVDLATDARPDAVRAAVDGWADHLWLQGYRFGTVGLERDGVRMEVTTFRGDVYRPESRKPVVEYGTKLREDLRRRDFTVNAMAVSVPGHRFTDEYDGLTDLADRRLRTPGTPEESFGDDPLRMLRAARFVAAFGLEPTPELVAAMGSLRHRLEIVSPERIGDELSRLLAGDHRKACQSRLRHPVRHEPERLVGPRHHGARGHVVADAGHRGGRGGESADLASGNHAPQ